VACSTVNFIFTPLYRRGKQYWHFMGSEGSLPRSQQPNNCPHLKPDKSLTLPLYLFINIRFNNSAPLTSGSSSWCLSFRRQTRHTPHHITIHFDGSTCPTIVTKLGVNSVPASCLSTPYGKQYQHGGRANSRGACSCPRTTEQASCQDGRKT